jgi:hypothetical protein
LQPLSGPRLRASGTESARSTSFAAAAATVAPTPPGWLVDAAWHYVCVIRRGMTGLEHALIATCQLPKRRAQTLFNSTWCYRQYRLVVQHSCTDSNAAVRQWVSAALSSPPPLGAMSIEVLPQSSAEDLGSKLQSAVAQQMQAPGVSKVWFVRKTTLVARVRTLLICPPPPRGNLLISLSVGQLLRPPVTSCCHAILCTNFSFGD